MALTMNVRPTMDQPGGRGFARLLRLRGCLGALCFGAAAYIVASFLDQHGALSSSAELALALAPTPANVLVAWLFFRDWRAALED